MSCTLLKTARGFGGRSILPFRSWTGALLTLAWLVCAVHSRYCPPECSCEVLGGRQDVDCSSSGLLRVPNFHNISEDIFKLDLHNNSIMIVMERDFVNLTNLNWLDLRNNTIVSVGNRTFARSNLFRLQQLYLGHNRLRSIPDDALEECQLEVLDLSFNYLSAPPRALAHSSSIGDLRLNNNPFYQLAASAFDGINTKSVTTLELSCCKLTSDTLHPLALRGDNFLSLTTLYLDSNFFPELNSSFFEHYVPSLMKLHLENCSISKLGRGTFRSITSLSELYLARNNFEVLERNLFQGLNLMTLDLGYCNIGNIKRGAFRTIIRDKLYLDHNNLSVIHNRDFLDLLRVQELILSYSNISVLQGNPFENLIDLRKLYLDHNRLTSEELNASLMGAKKVNHLDLSSNNIDRFPNVSTSKFPQLITLVLSQNPLRHLRRQEMGNLSLLHTLLIKQSGIAVIDHDALACCPNLTVLDLDSNELTQLPNMRNIPDLVNLHVSYNELESLPKDLCETNPRLLILQARKNNIRTIPPFSQCKAIFSIVLNNNSIQAIPEGAFANLTRLYNLDLSRNEIEVLPSGVFSRLYDLNTLRLDENNIKELPNDTLSDCVSLFSLNLGSNKIKRLEKCTFYNNTHLDEIWLYNNSINYIDDEAFPEGMNDLKLLNLSFNPDLESWKLPSQGFPKLRVIALEQMFHLHQVPSQTEIPDIQEMYFTYAYHCCIWDNVEQPPSVEMNDNDNDTDTDTNFFATVPTEPVLTLPPKIQPLGRDDPFLRECDEQQKVDPIVREHLIDFQAIFNLTLVLLPNCEIKIIWNDELDFDGGGSQDIGTNQDEFFSPIRDVDRPVRPLRLTLECIPRPNPLTPCQNLMDPWPLRVAIWAVWVLALLGNGTVLFVMIAARGKMDVPQILICNLAFADFCIGVYLAFLAVVDVRTYGDRSFYQSALDWQLGPGCKTAGFIAVFSSELSVYSLVALTLERVYTIAHTFNQNHCVRKRVALLVITLGWILSAVIASLPLFEINSYSRVAVCLPFVTERLKDKLYIGLVLSLNLIGFFIILASYIYIFCSIRKSPLADQNRRETLSAAGKIALLILATFICWVPLAIIGYSALADMPLVTAGQAKYLIVLVYPINACVNPFIYAIFTRQFRQRIRSFVGKPKNKKVQSIPPTNPIRIQRAGATMSSECAMGRVSSPKSCVSPEDLMKLRQSRRSNSFSVQLVDTNPVVQSPTPPTPRGVFMGRRRSLPAVFGSTTHTSNTQGDSTYPLPFRLGPLYSSCHNSSLPNLQEEDDEASTVAVKEAEVVLNGSQVSNESMMRRLSVVEEKDEDNIERNQSESESEYSDAQESVQHLGQTAVGTIERSTDTENPSHTVDHHGSSERSPSCLQSLVIDPNSFHTSSQAHTEFDKPSVRNLNRQCPASNHSTSNDYGLSVSQESSTNLSSLQLYTVGSETEV